MRATGGLERWIYIAHMYIRTRLVPYPIIPRYQMSVESEPNVGICMVIRIPRIRHIQYISSHVGSAAQAACEAMYHVIRVLESAGPDLNFPLWPEIVRPPCYVRI